MTTLVQATASERAAVLRTPLAHRCADCAGFGWRILSAYSWRWHRSEPQTRATCDACGGSGLRHMQAA